MKGVCTEYIAPCQLVFLLYVEEPCLLSWEWCCLKVIRDSMY